MSDLCRLADSGYSREEPYAGKPHVRICEGESRMAELLDHPPEKDTVSYQGVYYTVEDARAIVQRLTAFADWAGEMYQQRP